MKKRLQQFFICWIIGLIMMINYEITGILSAYAKITEHSQMHMGFLAFLLFGLCCYTSAVLAIRYLIND